MKGEQGTAESDPSDARTVARQHTAQLLNMLRGYGPTVESTAPTTADPVAAVESSPPKVADAAGAYRRCPKAPNFRPAAPPGADSIPTAPARLRRQGDAMLTVGEALRRQQGVLGRLMAQAAHLAQSSRIFQAYLPLHLHAHTILLRLDQDAWTVQTESSGWASRLRYALHDIRPALGQQLGFPLPKPRIQVAPGARPVQTHRPRLTLTPQNAQLLEIAARNMPDARLSAALQRLAEHVGPAHNPATSG